MQKVSILLAAAILLVACSRKTVPVQSLSENKSTVTAPVAMIVIDGYGRILTPKQKLPANENIKADYARMARAFTPNERKNLLYRFKTIPPRVIYVSEPYTQHSLKGTYCVYKQKFWYWKKAGGLFYLDKTYYK